MLNATLLRFFVLALATAILSCPPLTRGVVAAFSNVPDVRAKGVSCDGVTDDTAAFQSAIDGAGSTGTELMIPSGVCIISPPTANYVFRIHSGLRVHGHGMGISVLKMKDHAGDYTVVFGEFGATYNNLTFSDFTIDYNDKNNPAAALTPHGRLAIGTNQQSSGMTWQHVEFRDIGSINVIYSGGDLTEVTSCRFVLNRASTLYHDHSTLYIAANRAVISNNVFKGQINAPGAVTAIETHGGAQTISGNVIDGYLIGMNVTGVARTDSEGIAITGNSITNGYYGIVLWSNIYRSHTQGYGLAGLTITGNILRLTHTLWKTNTVTGAKVIGNTTGIAINPTATLPVRTVLIANNAVEFDLESSADAPFSAASEMGIGYWDSTNSTPSFNIKITGNIVINAPASGIRWASSGGDNIEISDNTIINAGSLVVL